MADTLLELISRTPKPAPWSEGDNIPWDDPEFSERMLAEHLSQDHDLASRRSDAIEIQANWIHASVLDARPARVLDLACGPGLYARELARKGCECVGIDFSPASIRHAEKVAADERLTCSYHHADVREARYGDGFDLVMMIYGQLNVFPRAQGLQILKQAQQALRPGGSLLLEMQSEAQIRKAAEATPSWYSALTGLFSAAPHIVLEEHFWEEEARASTVRFSVIDGKTAQVRTYALSNEAYAEGELSEALEEVGFEDAHWFPSLTGQPVAGEQDLPVVVARDGAGL